MNWVKERKQSKDVKHIKKRSKVIIFCEEGNVEHIKSDVVNIGFPSLFTLIQFGAKGVMVQLCGGSLGEEGGFT